VCEGMSGFRYVNGFADQAPVRPNLSIGDTVAGLHAAFGIALALLAKQKDNCGQVVDVALVESMFNLMEGVVPEYSGAGIIREPSGTTVTGIVPTNTYRCSNGKYVVIGGNGDSIFKRLMTVIGRADFAEDVRMANNAGRVVHQVEIDNAIAAWCLVNDSSVVIDLLEKERVPVGPIYNVADQFADPHFQARELFERVEIDGEPLAIPALLPKLCGTPGATEWPGGAVGSHNQEVLGDILGIDEKGCALLREQGVIS
jgi:crotonobetainyl-CoA:carnitine CoA-transferase CaiB-like acyl-CoA transferase